MKKVNRLILLGAVLTLCVMGLTLGKAQAKSGLELETNVVALGGSGVFGSATVDITDEGLHGKLKAHNLTSGHGYTVWFFYIEGTATGGPGRFDSSVAETGDVVFRGRVGGLQVSSGATIRLVIFDHPDLGPDNVSRANNLLTPAGAFGVARADFVVP